jgi:hypothetical protein
MRATTTSSDFSWALTVTAVGAATILLALRARWAPGDLDPGIEGCLTGTVLGFVMALLHGLPYRGALALAAPTLMAQYFICAHVEGQAVGAGITGIQLVTMGIVGLALTRGEQQRAEEAAPAGPMRPAGAHS